MNTDPHLDLNDRLGNASECIDDAYTAIGQAYRAAADLALEIGEDDDLGALMRQLLDVADTLINAKNNLPDAV